MSDSCCGNCGCSCDPYTKPSPKVRAEWRYTFLSGQVVSTQQKLFLFWDTQYEAFTSLTKQQAIALYDALRLERNGGRL